MPDRPKPPRPYQPPRLYDVGTADERAFGATASCSGGNTNTGGQCNNGGRAAAGQCHNGNSAGTGSCTNGNRATGVCSNGNRGASAAQLRR
jgi:hypothetical protein